MSSSHLFSLLCLYFSVFHDAKPEWEWTNLLLPERTEWAAAIRCVRTRDGGRDGGIWRKRGRGGEKERGVDVWTTVRGSLREGDGDWYRKVNNWDEHGTGKERVNDSTDCGTEFIGGREMWLHEKMQRKKIRHGGEEEEMRLIMGR